MRVSYCDFCSLPIKGYRWIVILAKFHEDPAMGDVSEEPTDFCSYSYAARNYVLDEKREICETCYHIMKDIFAKRMRNICEKEEDLRRLYEKPSKEDTDD